MTDSATNTFNRIARYRVEGMDCAGCAAKIDTAVRRMSGVSDVAVSVTAGTMTVHHDATSDLTAIEKKVRGLGYSVAALSAETAPASSPACCDHDLAGHDNEGHYPGDHAAKEVAGLHGHDHDPSDGPVVA